MGRQDLRYSFDTLFIENGLKKQENLALEKLHMGFPGGSSGEEPASAGDVRDVGLTRGLGRPPEERHDNPLQYSCLDNPMDRGA